MKLNERQVAFLRVLAKDDAWDGGMNPGWIFKQAYPDAPHAGRRDAGATRTLDSMEKLGLVHGSYDGLHSTGRRWTISKEGRALVAKLDGFGALVRAEIEKLPRLGSLNQVPGHPDYVYGLAVREGEYLTVDVCEFSGSSIGTVRGRGWVGAGTDEPGVHQLAQELIDKQAVRGCP